MEIVEFNENNKDQYTNFLLQSNYKDILQSWEWGEVKSNFNWQVTRIGFFENTELKGICQILEKRLSFGFSLLYIPRGPITDWNNYDLVQKIINQLKLFFTENKKNKKYLFLRFESPSSKKPELIEIFKNAGFKKYFKTVQPPSTLLIDLNPSKEELFKKLRRTARNLVNRSEKEGISLEVLSNSEINQENLKAFYNLYRLTGKRFSFPLRPFKQFIILLKEMAPSGNIRLYIAKIRGLILAYGIIMVLGDRAFYIWGGTGRHDYYSKFFNYGYIWEILMNLKNSGVKIFDFWGLGPEEDKNHPWHGFTLFKKAFDGQRFDYLEAFDLPMSKLYPLFKLIDKIITPKYRATSS
jgi:peptidoglycan pentaglycine glycine transferase (the first glycine)